MNRVACAAISLFVILSACATPPSARIPAAAQAPVQALSNGADTIDPRFESAFEQVLGSAHPDRAALKELESIVTLFYRAQAEVARFDAEIEAGAIRLFEHRSYSRLLAYHDATKNQIERFSTIYRRLLETRSNSARTSSRFIAAHTALAAISRALHDTDGADRLALRTVAQEIKPTFEYFADKIRGETPVTSDALPKLEMSPLSHLVFEQEGEIGDFTSRAEVQTELAEKSRAAGLVHDELSARIERNSVEIKRQIKAYELQARAPQPITGPRVFPSVGKNGTVSGLEWAKGEWSLTFDDGPHPVYSAQILANLEKRGMHATFFELAMNAVPHPEISKLIIAAGMPVENHTYTHKQLSKVTDAQLDYEVNTAQKVLTGIFGYAPPLFRLPYGDGLHDLKVRQKIADAQLVNVFWDVDSLDWQDPNPVTIIARVRKQMQSVGRGVVLMHDIHPQTVEASAQIMDDIKNNPTIRPILVPDAINELNGIGK